MSINDNSFSPSKTPSLYKSSSILIKLILPILQKKKKKKIYFKEIYLITREIRKKKNKSNNSNLFSKIQKFFN
jgi:hypothetical protein